MPERRIIANKLSGLLSALSHPYRIQIIEELRDGEKDVTELQELLDISQSSVSQHLGILKSHHLVEARGEGRHKYYHLSNETIADWLLQGLSYVEEELLAVKEFNKTLKLARKKWHADEKHKEKLKA